MSVGQKFGKFVFLPDVPEDVRPGILRALEKNMDFVPNWCEEIQIRWSRNEEEADEHQVTAAYASTFFDYRYAVITICPSFLDEDEAGRESIVRHELFHPFYAPLVKFMRDVLNAVFPKDTPEKKIYLEQIREKYEGATQDLATAIGKFQRKFSATSPRPEDTGTARNEAIPVSSLSGTTR
jgi:hypothetical protein